MSSIPRVREGGRFYNLYPGESFPAQVLTKYNEHGVPFGFYFDDMKYSNYDPENGKIVYHLTFHTTGGGSSSAPPLACTPTTLHLDNLKAAISGSKYKLIVSKIVTALAKLQTSFGAGAGDQGLVNAGVMTQLGVLDATTSDHTEQLHEQGVQLEAMKASMDALREQVQLANVPSSDMIPGAIIGDEAKPEDKVEESEVPPSLPIKTSTTMGKAKVVAASAPAAKQPTRKRGPAAHISAAASMSSTTSTAASPAAVPPAPVPTWSCKDCTFFNPGLANHCAVCYLPRNKKAKKEMEMEEALINIHKKYWSEQLAAAASGAPAASLS
jgi:hypothetical protein